MNLRDYERESIRSFVQSAADDGYLSGLLLDVGAGKQPYRDIAEQAGCDYIPFDMVGFPANVSGEDLGPTDWPPSGQWDTILCTQVVQYVSEPVAYWLRTMHWLLSKPFNGVEMHGHLVLTYPTNWPEVEPEDLHRFTKAGMERLLIEAGFEIIKHEWRHGFRLDSGESFTVGYGVIARA